jgi:hypothetical protein
MPPPTLEVRQKLVASFNGFAAFVALRDTCMIVGDRERLHPVGNMPA